jgi:hypothetical protein
VWIDISSVFGIVVGALSYFLASLATVLHLEFFVDIHVWSPWLLVSSGRCLWVLQKWYESGKSNIAEDQTPQRPEVF